MSCFFKNIKIVLVENSESDAELFISMLIDSGFDKNHIFHVRTLNKFEKAASSGSFDIVVTDYILDSFTAADVIMKCKELGLNLPVICLSGEIGGKNAVSLLHQGIKDIVLKEDINELPQSIEAAYNSYVNEKKIEKMKEAVTSGEKKFKSLFNNLFIGIVVHELIYDKDGNATDYRFIEMNKMAEDILRIPRKDMVGHTALEVYKDPNPPYIDIYAKVAQTGKSHNFETYYKSMDKYFNVTAYTTDPGTFITIFSDITDQINIGEQLRNSQKLEAVGTLASGVAHEINNPINGIMNYSQIIMDMTEKDSQIYDFALNISKESERIADITRNLLQFSRQDSAIEQVDFDNILRQTISLVSAIIRKESIKLTDDLNVESDVLCSAPQIEQIVMNLLLNARNAVNKRWENEKDAEKKIMLKSEVFSESGSKWVRVIVQDNGSGIPEQIRERIFDPFFTTKSRVEGTGLGLAISLRIATVHGGRLYFETEENSFTKFFLEIPANGKA